MSDYIYHHEDRTHLGLNKVAGLAFENHTKNQEDTFRCNVKVSFGIGANAE
jgi:hypothetical protein